MQKEDSSDSVVSEKSYDPAISPRVVALTQRRRALSTSWRLLATKNTHVASRLLLHSHTKRTEPRPRIRSMNPESSPNRHGCSDASMSKLWPTYVLSTACSTAIWNAKPDAL